MCHPPSPQPVRPSSQAIWPEGVRPEGVAVVPGVAAAAGAPGGDAGGRVPAAAARRGVVGAGRGAPVHGGGGPVQAVAGQDLRQRVALEPRAQRVPVRLRASKGVNASMLQLLCAHAYATARVSTAAQHRGSDTLRQVLRAQCMPLIAPVLHDWLDEPPPARQRGSILPGPCSAAVHSKNRWQGAFGMPLPAVGDVHLLHLLRGNAYLGVWA